MNLKIKNSEANVQEQPNYEKLIKNLLEIVKEKSTDRETSIKDEIIKEISKFQD